MCDDFADFPEEPPKPQLLPLQSPHTFEHKPVSLKDAIQARIGDEELEPLEYENLLLDGVGIGEISLEDKEFLEQFKECTHLSLNSSQL